ncbi:MFS transporter (plasmid) [Streptomyces sp. BI20]|uniref:MFS transporter n=1 Tax=Streptomyces sp. BI20 TaxID=3403460 RepID=UPI003C741152
MEPHEKIEKGATAWPGVAAIAGATFTVVTSELLPVGLLTPMGRALDTSPGTAGLALTATGVVAAVTAVPVTALFGRTDRRVVLALLTALVGAGNLVAGLAPGVGVLMIGRVLVGLGMGGVWAVAASGLAGRLVPAPRVAAANSVIFGGVAVASVLGVPSATYLAEAFGWRAPFLAAGALALLVAGALLVLLPALPAANGVRAAAMGPVVRDPRIRIRLLAIALLVTGHFAAYTYVRPALEEIAGASAAAVGALLLLYGLAGVTGNFLSGTVGARSPRRTLAVIGVVIAAGVALLPWLGGTPLSAGILIGVWGLAYGGVSVTTQNWMAEAGRDADRETVSAVYVGVFNAAIAAGALIGGLIADATGLGAVLLMGAALALAAAAGGLPRTAGRAPEQGTRTVARGGAEEDGEPAPAARGAEEETSGPGSASA